MDKKDIDVFINKLENDIKTAKDKLYEAEMMSRLKEAAKIYAGEDRVISSAELAEDIKQRPEETKIFTGINGLDGILNGFRPNQLVVIAAPTKNGKTSFCMDLTSKMKQHNPMWFPFEEGADELITKFIERGEDIPHFCVPKANTPRNLLWLEQKIIEAIVKYDSKIVFIDHLHFIVPFAADRPDMVIGQVMRDLKTMAKRWGITIVLIAHLKKTKMEKTPELDDLRDSSFVAQEADTVILLWRQSKKEDGQMVITNNVNVSVQANRRTGKTGNIKMVYRDGHFVESAWVDEILEKAFGNLDDKDLIW